MTDNDDDAAGGDDDDDGDNNGGDDDNDDTFFPKGAGRFRSTKRCAKSQDFKGFKPRPILR